MLMNLTESNRNKKLVGPDQWPYSDGERNDTKGKTEHFLKKNLIYFIIWYKAKYVLGFPTKIIIMYFPAHTQHCNLHRIKIY